MVADPLRVGHGDITGQLQELVLESGDVEGFLTELARLSAVFFSAPGNRVSCAFTVLRNKRGLPRAVTSTRGRWTRSSFSSVTGPASPARPILLSSRTSRNEPGS
jgi:hypothetical protein